MNHSLRNLHFHIVLHYNGSFACLSHYYSCIPTLSYCREEKHNGVDRVHMVRGGNQGAILTYLFSGHHCCCPPWDEAAS